MYTYIVMSPKTDKPGKICKIYYKIKISQCIQAEMHMEFAFYDL